METNRKTRVELLSLQIAYSDLPITVTRRLRQKHIRIRISPDGRITLSAPIHTSLNEVKKVLRQKEEWILTKLRETSWNIVQLDPLRRIYLCGSPYSVDFAAERISRYDLSIEYREKNIKIVGPSLERETIEGLISKWLRNEAHKLLIPLAREISRELGIPYRRIFLRNQRTRWGSSSSIGNISLNWRVIMLPTAVQRYLIIHELAHQRQLNHSSGFWQIVGEYCPDYRECENILKANRALMGLFRSP